MNDRRVARAVYVLVLFTLSALVVWAFWGIAGEVLEAQITHAAQLDRAGSVTLLAVGVKF